jgi:hypothetical protein
MPNDDLPGTQAGAMKANSLVISWLLLGATLLLLGRPLPIKAFEAFVLQAWRLVNWPIGAPGLEPRGGSSC